MEVMGKVEVRRNGLLVARGRNLIVTSGLELLAELIASGATRPSHMAIGSDGSRPTLGETDLQGTEFERVSISTSRSGREITYLATFGSGLGSTSTVQEYGIFNDPSAGTMLARFTSPAVDVQPGDDLEVTWVNLVGGE
jgi:hypothetical protein